MVNFMFTGVAGAGKTTLADKLVDADGYTKFSFATRLKEIAEEIKMGKLNKHEPKDRKLLQMLGTEVGRGYDPDMWVKQLAKKIKDTKEIWNGFDGNKIVIDDCRFLNEAKWGRENGFIIVRIVGRGYTLSPELANHPSEVEQRQIVADFELDNSGTVDESISKLNSFLDSLP